MSQREVQEFLAKNKGQWFTARQISKEIGINPGSCTSNITSLVRHQQIKKREHGKRYCFEYGYKGKENEN